MSNMSSEPFEFKTKKEKDWLKGLLRESIVDITFTKKDGSERKMKCTLFWVLKNEMGSLMAFEKLREHTTALLKSAERFARNH